MDLDLDLLRLIAAHRVGWVDVLTRGLMEVGMSPLTYLAAFVLCVLLGLLFRAWRVSVAALVAAVAAVAVADVGKQLIGRPRPPGDLALVATTGLAMPSSIAAMTSAAAIPVILLGIRMGNRAGHLLVALLVAATVVTGVSMVYLGAHWLSDVLVGWALGAVLGAAIMLLLERVRFRRAPAPG
ncbi:phosphatase PAP2 family protein [Geodermatophilus sp. SYSU D00758]